MRNLGSLISCVVDTAIMYVALDWFCDTVLEEFVEQFFALFEIAGCIMAFVYKCVCICTLYYLCIRKGFVYCLSLRNVLWHVGTAYFVCY